MRDRSQTQVFKLYIINQVTQYCLTIVDPGLYHIPDSSRRVNLLILPLLFFNSVISVRLLTDKLYFLELILLVFQITLHL